VSCGHYHRAWRPEAEAALALPQHDGRDRADRQPALRGVAICERSVLLDRYDELVAASAGTAAHRATLGPRHCGDLQPDVGHEVLWVIRNVLSGLVLLAPALLSSARDDLAGLVREVAADLVTLGIPVAGVVSDGSTLFVTYPPQFALNRSKPLYSVGRNVVRNLCCCQITETNEQVMWNSCNRGKTPGKRKLLIQQTKPRSRILSTVGLC
jgi:hypothetical protein